MAVHLLSRMDRSAFDVRMALLRRSGPYLSQVDESRVDVSPIGANLLDFDRGNENAYRPAFLLPGIALAPTNVVAMMRRFQPHVVMSFRKGMSVCALAAVEIYGRERVGFVAREGNNTVAVVDDELGNPLMRAAVKRLTAAVYKRADRLLTISHEMTDGLVSELGIPREHVRTVHNAVDLELVVKRAAEPMEHPQSEPFLVSVGRLDRQKAFDVLLDAYAGSEARHRVRLLILGEGPERPALEARARELSIADRVSMPGFVANPFAAMARARAFVLASRWEGFGLVIAEAMACGVPVVVTGCAFGPREIAQDGQSGIVVPVDDVAALRAGIDRVALDDAAHDQLAKQARRRARDFDLANIVRQYEAVLAEVADLKRRGRRAL